MGSRNSEAYLGSPQVVAASAIAGFICSPSYLQRSAEIEESDGCHKKASAELPTTNVYRQGGAMEGRNGDVRIVPGFKQKRHGSLLFCHQDSLNTDGIFAGTHTYNEELTLEMISKVVMENYDPNFSKLLQRGDVLVGGFNFGCGSSREQAATSLKLLGIDVIIAGSFSETYKRNAFNNGLLCIEIPDLVLQMKMNLAQAQKQCDGLGV